MEYVGMHGRDKNLYDLFKPNIVFANKGEAKMTMKHQENLPLAQLWLTTIKAR